MYEYQKKLMNMIKQQQELGSKIIFFTPRPAGRSWVYRLFRCVNYKCKHGFWWHVDTFGWDMALECFFKKKK